MSVNRLPSESFRSASREERGSVLLEFALVVPLLVFTFFAGVETIRVMGAYLRMSQIAYEGARYAASLPSLEEGTFQFSTASTMLATGSTVNSSGQVRLREIIYSVMRKYELNVGNMEVITEFRRSGPAIPDSTVTVELSADYIPLFGIGFPSFPIRVSASGPYLFPDRG